MLVVYYFESQDYGITVHVAGCRDALREVKQGLSSHPAQYALGRPIEATSVRQLAEDAFQDFIFSNDQQPWTDFVEHVHIKPCAGDLMKGSAR